MSVEVKRANWRDASRRYRAKDPDGKRARNSAYAREWRRKNRERMKLHKRNYYARHKTRLKARQRVWYEANRERVRIAERAWRKNNPERARARDLRHRLKNTYGISRETFDAMMKRQRGRYAICRKRPPKASKRGEWRVLCVDHCHRKHRVRGLLCQNCNVGLAHFRDNPKLLLLAVQYLRLRRHWIPMHS